MKLPLLMCAAMVLVGCGEKAAPLPAIDTPNEKNKLITNRSLEEDIRESIKKPYGKLTEADLEKVELLVLFGYMDDEGLKEVAKLQKLERLILSVHPDNTYDKSRTKITDEGLKDIAKLQNLTSLSLDRSQITDEGLKELAKLQKLKSLTLNFTHITGAGLKEVAKLQQFKDLSLAYTQITDAGLKEVAKLQKLERLSLTGTKVTKAGVAELKKALPKCEISGP